MIKFSLTEHEILENWKKLISVIEQNFDGERREKLLELYKYFEHIYPLVPASGKVYYHCSFPGGLVLHTLNVIDIAKQLYNLWKNIGFNLNYTEEEVVFCALNHDLGKVGDLDEQYYIMTDDRWKLSKGELYIHNPKIRWMDVATRSIFLLQHFGVKFNQTEMLGILLHDGMYDEKNKSYLVAYSEEKQLRDNLPILIHHADMTATLLEKDKFYYNIDKTNKEIKNSRKNNKKNNLNVDLSDLFLKNDDSE